MNTLANVLIPNVDNPSICILMYLAHCVKQLLVRANLWLDLLKQYMPTAKNNQRPKSIKVQSSVELPF